MKPKRIAQTTKFQTQKLKLRTTMVKRSTTEDAEGVVLTSLNAQGTVDSEVATTISVAATEVLTNQEEVPKTMQIRFMLHQSATAQRMTSESSSQIVDLSLMSCLKETLLLSSLRTPRMPTMLSRP